MEYAVLFTYYSKLYLSPVTLKGVSFLTNVAMKLYIFIVEKNVFLDQSYATHVWIA